MNVTSRIVVCSIAAVWSVCAVAEEAATNDQTRQLLARADVAAADHRAPSVSLDAYAGRYDVTDGIAFLVERDGDALTIELPEAYGAPSTRLYAAGSRNTFVSDGGVRVVFESDAGGRVLGLLLHTPSEVVAASKAAPKRGIVTVYDLSEEAVSSLRLDSLVRSF